MPSSGAHSLVGPENHQLVTNGNDSNPIQIETFSSFAVNQTQHFNISLKSTQAQAQDLQVTISSPLLGLIDKQLEWSNGGANCKVSFMVPMVGVYNFNIEFQHKPMGQFQAKAYDLSKVFINDSTGKCFVNDSYEFSVDASEAGEGQLEIAVNEGEIPNQVQVLDNGKCIVNFVPEDCVPHVVDIKFNGHNVNGCPFVVEVSQKDVINSSSNKQSSVSPQQVPTNNREMQKPCLIKEERILVNSKASFHLENVRFERLTGNDLIIVDPESRPVNYKLVEEPNFIRYTFEFLPSMVGDYTVELGPDSQLYQALPAYILDQFPFSLKVFDHNKVIVSDVVDGVIGHPVYFFIDASQAGSGNLEIRVSSKTRNVPNYPQSEANAKIRVNFTPTEAVDHLIDVKFNGLSVPGNQFLVRVAQLPQARLPVTCQDLLKYVAVDELISFQVDYLGHNKRPDDRLRPRVEELTEKSCQCYVLRPDFVYTKLTNIQLQRSDKHAAFKINFKPTKIGPYKLFITVNNELLPGSPIVSNVYNINEVKVFFENYSSPDVGTTGRKPVGLLDQPVTFTVDASRAGEGTLALAVVSGLSRSPVQTDVKVSEKGHGLYNLTFVPTELATHSIDMSFNDRVVPNSPFVVDILDSNGTSAGPASAAADQANANAKTDSNSSDRLQQNFENLSLSNKSTKSSKSTKKSTSYGLVNTSNIVYLETGVIDGGAGSSERLSLIGPNQEKVPFVLSRGSPQPGEPKKPFIEYKPKSIGTHTINVLGVNDKDLLCQYFVEICDPSLIRVSQLNEPHTVGKPVLILLDSSESGEIQLDPITILGPKRANGKIREGDQTILGRIKSISSSSSSQQQHVLPLECSLRRIQDHQQEIKFVPQVPGKYTLDVRCLGQSISGSPIELEVGTGGKLQQDNSTLTSPSKSVGGKLAASTGNLHQDQSLMMAMREEEELLDSIVVHGVSLKCSPVNSTGAFIIETNGRAQARDFDVLITDPSNNLVDVQCYLQEDGNLLAKWTPGRVGTHKIEVLYKERQVPGSPFVTEAFDPSGVIIENLKGTMFSVGDKIEFKLDRREAGCGELDVAITSPVGSELPIEVKPLEDDDQVGELVSFKPSVAGKYKMSITFGGYEVPKSPITFTARETAREQQIKLSGTGLRCAEVNRSAQFQVDTLHEGELKVRIECGDREIVPKIERRQNGYTIKYKPTEVGYSTISLYWNGSQIEGSPFAVPINDLGKILFLSGTNKSSISTNQRHIDYEPQIPKEITLDTNRCGPGELKAEAYCRANPSIKFSLPTTQYASNRYRIEFVLPPRPEQLAKGLTIKDLSMEATYLIRFYYNNLFVPEPLASVLVCPLKTSANNQKQPQQQQYSYSRDVENNNSNGNHKVSEKVKPVAQQLGASEEPVVALRGHGLVDARCGEEAEFSIDGTGAGPGSPQVRFTGLGEEVQVRLEEVGERRYKATYVGPSTPGSYSLNVLWDGKQVAGCPITVQVVGDCDASKVICTGDGLKGGILGEEIKVFIDTRRAGPGELTALCTGPQKVAFCELLDRGDGTFILYIKPQEPGRQFLTIKYGAQHIPKSPFLIKVSGKPDPSKVRVYGPGVEHGVLSLYQSRFVCDTRGAGAGQLTVRIRGPKGAFRMETQRESQRDRTILCKYDPTEPGDYRIEIKWSGRHVPGSPFSVMIFDTQEELNRFLIGGQAASKLHHHHHQQLHSHHHHPQQQQHHHQVPYHPTLVEYGQYPSGASNSIGSPATAAVVGQQVQPPTFRLQ